MDFREVEERFQELKSKLDADTIDEAEFEAELRRLYVMDAEGRYWMMGAQTGQWYYYDGAQWVQAERPEEEAGPPTESPAPKPPPASPKGPKEAAPTPPTKKRTSNLAMPIVVGLVILCCAFAAGSVVVSEFVLTDKPISSFVESLVGRRPTTPGPISTMGPSPTVGVSADEYIRTGDQLFDSGRYEEAITQYQTAISLEPQDAEAYARLGQAYLQLGTCEQAIPEFQQALALNPDLESAQAGLMECGGALPPDVSFASYSRSDLDFSLLYPSTWFVREEELQTIFAENEEDADFLRGNIFFISALSLGTDEEGMDSMGALIKARQLINLPMGSQLGGVETVSLAGWEWASVRGEITGLQTPTTIYIAATVKDSSWYGIWAIGPTETWEQISWPIFRTMASTVQLEQVVALASPTMEASPPIGESPVVTPAASPTASPAASPTASPSAPTPTPTSLLGASPTSPPPGTPTPTTPPATPTTRPSTLTGKIAYPVYLGGQHYEVRIANLSGSVLHTISNVSEPNLRSDGARIAVRSWEGTARALFLMNLDGSNRRRITNFLEDSLPRWAGDQASVALATKREGPHHESRVYTYTPGGGERSLGEGDMPDWSPDGGQIVAKGSVSATGLIIMGSGGGDRRQLTANPNDSSPDWSSTGNKIAFMRLTGINWDIWVVNSDGSGETKLTSDGSIDGLPAWSPDGTSIAFLSNRGGPWAIWVMNGDGSNQRKLFNTGSSNYATGPFDGEFDGREPNQPRDWYDEQISWSR